MGILEEVRQCIEAMERSGVIKFPETGDKEICGESGIYTVNIGLQTCTCPDFQMRMGWPAGHMRRLCKHLASAMADQTEAGTLLHEALTGIKNFGFSAADRFWLATLAAGPEVFLFCHSDRDWCDVIAPGKKGSYALYGFSPDQQRWSYKESPPKAPEIKALISKWISILEAEEEAENSA